MNYNVTPSQRGMLLHQTVHPLDNGFDLAFLWRLTGAINRTKLRAAIDHVLGDMTAFRTSYDTAGGQLVAEVHPGRPKTEVLELPRELPDADAEGWLTVWAHAAIDGGPFSPSARSQARCAIGHTDAATYVFLHTAHIAGDVYACYEMFDAMAECYESEPATWSSITERLREHPGSIVPNRAGDLALDGLTALYANVESFSNAAIATTRPDGRMAGSRITFPVPADVVRDLRRSELYLEFGAVAVLYSAYAAMIHRLCATDGFVVGLPVADRAGVVGKAASGFFVNTLPLPLEISLETSWRDLVAQMRKGLSTLQRSKSIYPLTVHRERVCPHVTNQTLDNAVTYYKRELKPRFSGVASASIPLARATVPYPIMVTFADEVDSITVELSIAAPFETAGLDTELVAMLGAIARDAEGQVVRPEFVRDSVESIDDPPLLSESLWQRIQSRAAQDPEHPAIRAERIVTYRDLVADAERFAEALNQIDASRYVVLSLAKSSASIVAFAGIMASGRVCVPVDPSTPQSRFEHIVETLVVADGSTVSVIADSESSHPALGIDSCSVESFDELQRGSRNPSSGRDNQVADTAYVIFTSGSTGRPKGVDVGHAGLLPLFDGAAVDMDFTAADTWIWLHSGNFDYSIWEIFCALATGATLCIPDKRTHGDPVALAEYIASEEISVLCETPAGLKRFGRLVTERRELFSRIRVLTVGGEAFSARELDAWREHMVSGLRVYNMYGLTENTIVATVLPMDLVPADLSTNLIGHPVASIEAVCLDRYGRVPLPGQAGELHLAGPGLAHGYLGRPAETDERFRRLRQANQTVRRWLATGDRCTETEYGYAFMGRLDSQVQLRGFRIELGDIESSALLCEGVASAVAAIIDGADAPFLAIWYSGLASETQVLDHLRQTLPAYMVPVAVRRVPEFPTTSNGKTDLASLKRELESSSSTALHPTSGGADASGQLQEIICRIWGEVTGRSNVLPSSRLFDLGGTSLDAVEIARRLNELPRPIVVDVVDLFEYTTPAELASYIEAQQAKERVS